MSRRKKGQDKPKRKASLNDYILNNQQKLDVPIISNPNSTPIIGKNETKNSYYIPQNIDNTTIELEYNKRVAYNSKLDNMELDPNYTSIKPLRNILIRIYSKVPTIRTITTVDGSIEKIYTDQPIKVPIQTIAGKGIKGFAASPYPITDKAVIVSVPEIFNLTYKVGDIIHLGDIPLRCPFPGQDTVIPTFAYTHPDLYTEELVPKQVDNEHFGYFLVPDNMILTFLKMQPRDTE